VILTETVADRLAAVRTRIDRAGGDPDTLRVLAVTKGFGTDALEAALGAGLTDFGENYAEELLEKALPRGADGPAGPPRWHYLGAVQRRKVARLAPVVDCWQSVCRVVEGEAIHRHRAAASVMIQVETTGAAGRNGCPPHEVKEMAGALSSLGLLVTGLMTVAPQDPEGARRAFRTVRGLADSLGLPERSMGMTDDLELAVAEGSTLVRIGRGLFGDRPPRPASERDPRGDEHRDGSKAHH